MPIAEEKNEYYIIGILIIMTEAKKRPNESKGKLVLPKGFEDAQCASNPRRAREKMKERPIITWSGIVKPKKKTMEAPKVFRR